MIEKQVKRLVCYLFSVPPMCITKLYLQLDKMKSYKSILLLVIPLMLFSCIGNKPEAEFKRPVFKETPVANAYATIRPSMQKFEIDNNQTTRIVADKKTEILIPKDCFVDNHGNPVKGSIEMEVVEVFALADFITAGLATLSDDKLLISNGMLYLDAKSASGNSLQIKDGAAISVSMPTMKDNNGFQMFTGDGTNWTVDSSMLEADYLIPLPLDLLYPYGNQDFAYHWFYFGDEHGVLYYDTTIVSFTNSKFENTIIATEEFSNRHFLLLHLMSKMSILIQEDYLLDKVDDRLEEWNYEIWKIYYENSDQPLYVLDSLAKQHYFEYFAKNKSKLIALTDKVNLYKQEYYDYHGLESHDYFDFNNQTIDEWFLRPLNHFPDSTRKELKLIDDYGVDLNAADAYAELKALDVSLNEIDDILKYHFKRQSLIKQLQREKQAIADKETLSKIYATTVFSLKKLGWINCDFFYNDSKADKAEIFLANSSERQLDFIDFSLVISDLNVRLMSFQRENDLYSFTKEDGPYTKLPIGKEAIVIGVAVQNDSVFYASQSIKISDGLNLDFKMEYIPTEVLKDSLELVLN